MDNKLIDTEDFSHHLRAKGIDTLAKKILITNYSGIMQEQDITEPINCHGYGRIRHFRLGRGSSWPINPLPILPAAKALGIEAGSEIKAQVFQNSICNWRCWYCFVDYSLLSGDRKRSNFFSCTELLDMYLEQETPPLMIDLTGGQPDLTPEWVPWMMEALKERNLDRRIFLWSDDNLSNDYFWRYLSDLEIDMVQQYPMYARVCCFKGIDEQSFSLNTKAEPSLFSRQFDLVRRFIELRLDLYLYITLTASTETDFGQAVPRFLDRLQEIAEELPLRTVPLEILEFTPVKPRMNQKFVDSIKGQYEAIDIWQREIERRFSSEQRDTPITEILNVKRSNEFRFN